MAEFSGFDISCMKRALSLARRGAGKTSPNPMVGALIAREGRVLGEGWHRKCGGKHAEAEALDAVLAAGASPAGADLYCTLEPCSFTGHGKRQPPCAPLIVKSGIRRVVIANTDPNPLVNGGGVQELRRAGVAVETGLLSKEAAELNRDFFAYHKKGRPFVHVKIAESLDGRITSPPGGDRWITGEATRKIVHRLRARYDAVLVGIGTAIADDPELTVRLARGRNPLRVILDSHLRLPLAAKILGLRDREKTLLFCGPDADADRVTAIRRTGASVFSCAQTPDGGLSLQAVLAVLGERGVRSILVEGGAGVFTSFLREALWDRLSVFIAPRLLGGGIHSVTGLAGPRGMRFQDISIRRIGDHVLWEADGCLPE